ncbi:MAG TPA: sugar transferase [Bryobacteraceae bacterium]|jgi:exopolysaccharide biosynthesis polyprenyl glycosylphosphotransferase
MFHSHHPLAARVYAFVNAAVVLLVLLGVFTALNWDQMPSGVGQFLAMRVTLKNLFLTGLFLLSWTVAFRAFGLSRPAPAEAFWKMLLQVTKACTVTSAFALLFPLTTHSGAFTRKIVFYFLPAAILAGVCGQLAARAFGGRLARSLRGFREVIIVGSGPRALATYERLREPKHGRTRVLGFVDSPNDHLVSAKIQSRMLGGLEDLEAILMKQPVDEVLIALPAKSCYDQIQTTIQTCECAGVEARYLSDVFQLSLARPRFEPHETAPTVSLKVVQDDSRLLVKRAIDIVGAIVGLAVLGPLMLAITVAIRLTSPGPALFAQERYGWNKRRFRMYKFRTMVENADALQSSLEARNEKAGPIFKIKNDPRITPLGRILRVSSLDELPQFLNVLRGDMSLVGPRPMSVRDVLRFDDVSLMRRFSVKPGLTCLWQISGRSNTDFVHWIALDLKYIDTWSLSLDLKILAKTIPAVLTGDGAA